MARDLVFEIGTEELPAKSMPNLLEDLREKVILSFRDERLKYNEVKTFGTPRRLILFVTELHEEQEELVEEIRGPSRRIAFDPQGIPTQAAIGFARSKGVKVEDLVVKETDQGEYVFAIKRYKGRNTIDVLKELLPKIVLSLSLPKSMRWKGNLRFLRPIRWLLALYGSEVVEFELDGIKSGRKTRGHRFMGRGEFEVKSVSDFFSSLEREFVIFDQSKRKRIIEEGVKKLQREAGGKELIDNDLLEENVFLTEYPVVVKGSFREEFLRLPSEVLVMVMKVNQRYFPVYSEDGRLLPYFIAVSNNRASVMDSIIEGYNRVLEARFEDADFYYKKDLEKSLEERVPLLKGIVFLEKVGTMYDKMERIRTLALDINSLLGFPATHEIVLRTAYLAKADLVTDMVGEFPELQGIMGKEYALKSGEPEEVALGIFEHYLPRFAGDELPKTWTGIIVGIADKIDTILSCFMVGLAPTGSQDPYGLRRQARAINEIIWQRGLNLSLEHIVSRGAELLKAPEEVKTEVLEFLKSRIANQLRERGFTHSVIEAAMASGWYKPYDLLRRVYVLNDLSFKDDFKRFVSAFVRVVNILRGVSVNGEINKDLLIEDAERMLYEAFFEIKEKAEPAFLKGEYDKFLETLFPLTDYINAFFDKVLVMSPEESLRLNRLRLLTSIREFVERVGVISILAV
ncbi:MAG: glycine--tRNA ligase subunit beta [Synergistetes bacterium]|nr:glycine--tRNA ligase subunit beta [Synergistota bacterium]MCX8127309.1 glycine--tRNA ligase subunit beta [Synergistota bacterium]MDW8191804.1 glycine--tRNA ligase subunit beta [Synergistota bacterium]